MDLSALAAFAVNNNNSVNKSSLYNLSVEEARTHVVVKDGNKKAKEDGSQALTLNFGKVTLPLDVVAPKATRINATKEQVEQFTKVLLDAIAAGTFDAEIAQAQFKINPANKKAQAVPTVTPVASEGSDEAIVDAYLEQTAIPNVDGLDLNSIED